MKQSGQCPKCGGSELQQVPGKRGSYRGIATGMTVFSRLGPRLFVCLGCGYIEEYLEPGDIQVLRKKLGRPAAR